MFRNKVTQQPRHDTSRANGAANDSFNSTGVLSMPKSQPTRIHRPYMDPQSAATVAAAGAVADIRMIGRIDVSDASYSRTREPTLSSKAFGAGGAGVDLYSTQSANTTYDAGVDDEFDPNSSASAYNRHRTSADVTGNTSGGYNPFNRANSNVAPFSR